MKTLIMRFLTLFVVITGFGVTIPGSAFAIHFGPIPGADIKNEPFSEQVEIEGEHPEE
ncbi:hypothetical protein [Parachlamydia sp. AcF125]|uniref:hypothetical protein n=1 Tax=Parachlamydia sp. AcF125 TaxID=2795736 RepID=UPI001BC993B4|nr:hypothetical protein [Parachlamydia sp. AcF125]MBS4169151.1 hypothetical protein [Parachlamydia sp. AcF125]